MVIGTIRLRLVAGQHQNGDARLWLVEPWFQYHSFMSRPRKRRRQPDQSSVGPSPLVSTYQTRSAVYEGRDRADGDAGLSAYGELYAKVQHKLFTDVAAGRSAVSKKREYIEEHGIPARMFNAVRITLDGKVSAVRESQLLQLDSLRRRVSRGEKRVLEAEQGCQWRQVHGKRRRLANLKFRLSGLEADIAAGRVRLCFGSKKLWRKQYDLKANGYGSREAWLEEWREVRSNEFFVLGSRDETAGCQLCVAAVNDDGTLTLTLRLRMPDGLAGLHGKYLVVPNVMFASGHDVVLAALGSNSEYAVYRREHGEKEARATTLGQAISYRFKRDAKGWRVFATTELPEVEITTDRRRGAIGVDLNADHLAVAETDASGNYLKAWRVPLVTYGKNTGHAEAIIGDAVVSVVEHAREVGKPVVIEKLDFRQQKAVLEGESRKYSRMLSSFAYGKIKAYFISRAYRQGIEVKQVNPAYSSVIGRVKFMERYGLTMHQAAALVLARRLLGCSERIPRRWVCPVGNGVQVAFTVPVRKRVKHVWTYWGVISGHLRPALAAQHRLGKRRRRPNPVRAVVRAEARGVA